MKDYNLIEDMEYWRPERPDEWKMDEFIREVKKLQEQLKHHKTLQFNHVTKINKLEQELFDKNCELEQKDKAITARDEVIDVMEKRWKEAKVFEFKARNEKLERVVEAQSIHDIIIEPLIVMLHQFEHAGDISNKTADEVIYMTEGGKERYLHDPLYNMQIKKLTSVIVQHFLNRLNEPKPIKETRLKFEEWHEKQTHEAYQSLDCPHYAWEKHAWNAALAEAVKIAKDFDTNQEPRNEKGLLIKAIKELLANQRVKESNDG